MKLWYFHEFVHLFEPYGQVLAFDLATTNHLDFRVARVRVGLCDDQIPPPIWLMYYDQGGFWSHYDVSL
jgi:hypothetical protein